MRKYFVTYDMAMTLHKLGFSRHCIAWYTPQRKLENTRGQLSDGTYRNSKAYPNLWVSCFAPTWDQVVDWLESRYKIRLHVAYCKYSSSRDNGWRYTFNSPTSNQIWTGPYKSRLQATAAGIAEAIAKIQNEDKCTCERHGKTVWRITSTGRCTRCGKQYLNQTK